MPDLQDVPRHRFKYKVLGDTDFSPAQLAFMCQLVGRGKDVCRCQHLGCPHADECERITEAHWRGLLIEGVE